MEKIVSGEMCSRIIICWRKMSGEICLGELFVGEKCESLSGNAKFFDFFAIVQEL